MDAGIRNYKYFGCLGCIKCTMMYTLIVSWSYAHYYYVASTNKQSRIFVCQILCFANENSWKRTVKFEECIKKFSNVKKLKKKCKKNQCEHPN